MRHEEMTSSFVQYDVCNLAKFYLCTLLPLALSEAVCCVEVFTEVSH